MIVNQSQIVDFYFATTAEANAAVAQGKVCFIDSLKGWFRGKETSDAANGVDIIASADDNYAWVLTGGSGLLKGSFTTSGKYREGDYVTHNKALYRSAKDLSASTPPAPTPSSEDWELVAGENAISAYDKSKSYFIGEKVRNSDTVFEFLSVYEPADVDAQKSIKELISSSVVQVVEKPAAIIREWTANNLYFKDQLIYRNGKILRCNQTNGTDAAAFVDAEWDDFAQASFSLPAYNAAPVVEGELRTYDGKYILKAKKDMDTSEDFSGGPTSLQYEYHGTLGAISHTTGTTNMVVGSEFYDVNGAVWKVAASAALLVREVSHSARNDTCTLAVPTAKVITFVPSVEESFYVGQLIKYKGNVLRCTTAHKMPSSSAVPVDGNWVLEHTNPELGHSKLIKGTDVTYATPARATVYLSPEQHGGIYGTVYRVYLNTLTGAINEILTGITDGKLLSTSFTIDTWVSSTRGTGTADFSEVTASNNWPSDNAFRVRAFIDKTESEKSKIKVQQGDSVQVTEGWIDFTTSSSTYKDLVDMY